MPKLLALLTALFFLFTSSDAEARRKKNKHHKRSGVPAALKHSKAKQKQQNLLANKYKLPRIKNLAEQKKRIASKDSRRLVQVTDTSAYYLDPKIGSLDHGNKVYYHYTCTWVKDFLDTDLVQLHKDTGKKFKITSLTRPRSYQRKLKEVNGNAIVGKKWWQQSSHSTCSTVDISFYKLGSVGKKALRKKLIERQAQGKVIAVEEVKGGHFHVMVSPAY